MIEILASLSSSAIGDSGYLRSTAGARTAPTPSAAASDTYGKRRGRRPDDWVTSHRTWPFPGGWRPAKRAGLVVFLPADGLLTDLPECLNALVALNSAADHSIVPTRPR